MDFLGALNKSIKLCCYMLVCHKIICLKTLLNMIFYFQYIRYLWGNKIRFYYIRFFTGVPHYPKGYKID